MAPEKNITVQSFYIIDGSAYIFRAYYAIRALSNSNHLPTNAIYGFIQMLLKLVKDAHPDYLAVTFDTKGPTFRHTAYPAYKANRGAMPEDLAVQIPYIYRATSALGLFSILKAGYEADDLIGTLCKKGEAAGLSVTIVSGDKDMLQLLSPNIRMYDSLKEKFFTPESVQERFGVTPSKMIEIMGLMGDTADNIPGVFGVGEKTAKDLIVKFGTIENLFTNLNAVTKPKLKAALEKDQDNARLSRTLATIDTDCPIPFDLSSYRISPFDQMALTPLLKELEFSSLLKELSQVHGLNIQAPQRGDSICPGVHPPPDPALNLSDLPEKIEQIKAAGKVAICVLTADDLESIRIAICPGNGARSGRSAPFQLLVNAETFPLSLKEILESNAIGKIGHQIKSLLPILKKMGVHLSGPLFDTQIAAYLLNPTQRDYSFQSVAALLELEKTLSALLDEKKLSSLFYDLEIPLIPILAQMEAAGLKLDIVQLKAMSDDLGRSLEELTKRIYALAGKAFNINSPSQLAKILFEDMGLTPLRKTKTGYSTDEEVLTHLSVSHELPAEILNYRQGSKLKSTYVDVLPRLADSRTSRVHTQLNQTVTATGRLSSSDPNLQNIPVQGEWGRRIRQAFIAQEGSLLLTADYNQIELRILAHLSEDPALIHAFQTGEDIHLKTASEIFNLAPDVITSEMRRVGKTVNFGIVYGISPFGLASNLGVSQKEAKRYIDLYFSQYAHVKPYIEKTRKEAAQNGYVTTLFGRRRDVPELQSSNKNIREAGERLAVNTPIQGSAADVIKRAMVLIDVWMKERAVHSKMILQVHDELIFEVPEGEISLMQEAVVSLMETAASLFIPLKVDCGVGANWWAAKKG
ncbi:MAG: DNA polymerase I [Nitrospirota bacterium]